jgi:hypothetical protein
MKYWLCVRVPGLALLTILSTLAAGSRASADQVLSLTLDGNYNSTTIDFNYGSTAEHVSGGGVVGGSLAGVSLPYLYCLQWSLDVVVPNTYAQSLVNSSGNIHSGYLENPLGQQLSPLNSVTAAENVAWLVVNRAPLAGSDANQQAGLQALIWQQVTPGFTLTSTNTNLVNAYNADVTALAGATSQALAYDVSQVLFISPSTDGDVSNHNQALVGYIAPEPATLAMALSGLIPLGVVALRRRLRTVATP